MKVHVKSPILEARSFIGDIIVIDAHSNQWVVANEGDLDVARWCGGKIESSDLFEEPGKASMLVGDDVAWAGWYVVSYGNGSYRAFSPGEFGRMFDIIEE